MAHVTKIKTLPDPRSLLERLRRRHLEAILAAEGISAPAGIPAVSAREILRSNGVRVEKYLNRDGSFCWPERKVKEDMNRKELMRFCAKAGIPYTMKDTRDVLAEKAREYMNGNATAGR